MSRDRGSIVSHILETIALLILIGVAALRPLVAETYDPGGSALTEALGPISDPSPLHTLVFDSLILIAAGGVFLTRALGSTGTRPYRKSGLEWGLLVVTTAALISTLYAGNKRLAINASIDWLCYPILAVALLQLLDGSAMRRRLLAAAIVASACVQAFQVVEQYGWGIDETWQHYQSIKNDFWAKQGVDLASVQVELYEKRIQAHEAQGSFPHSNIAGAYLVLCVILGAGAALDRWQHARGSRDQTIAVLCGLVVAALFTAAILTKSLGALLSAGVGIVLWIAVVVLSPWISRQRTRAILLGWGCATGVILSAIAYGLYYDSLPHMSLNFRWQYWRASAPMIADHPWTGVGRENFGRRYLGYKSIESPEEISNPHNLFVQAAADWGVPGLVGVVLMLVGASVRICVGRSSQEPSRDREGAVFLEASRKGRVGIAHPIATNQLEHFHPALWTVALLLTVVLARLPLLGVNNPDFLFYASMTAGLCWLTGFLLFFSHAGSADLTKSAISSHVRMGAAVGLFSFLLQDMISFALFVPGSATTFFAALAIALADVSPSEPARDKTARSRRWRPVALIVGLVVVTLRLGFLPVQRAAIRLAIARESESQPIVGAIDHHPCDRAYRAAAEADPLDPSPWIRRARWLVTIAADARVRQEALGLAVQSLDLAIARDPFNLKPRHMLTQVYENWAETSGEVVYHLAAVDAARRALDIYPRDPDGLVSLADVEAEAGRAADREDLLRSALGHYQAALDLDAARPWWERIRRYKVEHRAAIESRLEQVWRTLPGVR